MVIIAPLDAITDTSLLCCVFFPGLDGRSVYLRYSRAYHNCIVPVVVVVLERGRVGETSVLSFVSTIVCRHRDTSRTPSAVVVASRTNDALFLASQASIVIVVMLGVALLSDNLADQPASADVLAIHNTAISQLDALSCPVYPSKVEVKQSLNYAEGKADREDVVVSFFGKAAKDPIEDIEGAVGTEGNEIEAVDDSRDRRLAEEK